MEAEIGRTLREARESRGLEISDLEERTKIRGKFLRALEDEEWSTLPDDASLASFMRTYAQAVGIDGQTLVDQYRRSVAPPPTNAAAYPEPPLAKRGVRPRRRLRPGLATAIVLGGVFGLLLIMGLLVGGGGGDDEPTPEARAPETTTEKQASEHRKSRRERERVELRLVAKRSVFVCLVDARNQARIDAEVLDVGESRGPFRAKRFRITMGNSHASLRVNGRRVRIPTSEDPVGYALTPGGARPLPPARQPTC